MEIALYWPELGFYERPENQPRSSSHFYTSVSVGPLFGHLLAFQLAQWLRSTNDRQLFEAGAADGQLASDILSGLRKFVPTLFREIRYHIIEPSERLQKLQQNHLREWKDQIFWHRGWEEVDGVSGLIFSNELLDAFPVHRLIWDAPRKEWMEAAVNCEEGRFQWTKIPWRSAPVPDLPRELIRLLPDGFAIEVNPAAERWWSFAANRLKKGRLLTIDYGGRALIRPEFVKGTLRAYRQHHRCEELLDDPGDQDLTADVDFEKLIRAGEGAGLETEYFLSQEKFLTDIAAAMDREGHLSWTESEKRQFKTLIHPQLLGASFNVLVQRRA